jgi:hypothetical protein
MQRDPVVEIWKTFEARMNEPLLIDVGSQRDNLVGMYCISLGLTLGKNRWDHMFRWFVSSINSRLLPDVSKAMQHWTKDWHFAFAWANRWIKLSAIPTIASDIDIPNDLGNSYSLPLSVISPYLRCRKLHSSYCSVGCGSTFLVISTYMYTCYWLFRPRKWVEQQGQRSWVFLVL